MKVIFVCIDYWLLIFWLIVSFVIVVRFKFRLLGWFKLIGNIGVFEDIVFFSFSFVFVWYESVILVILVGC